MVSLNTHSLAHLGANVSVPAYDPTAVTTSIVHFGVGAFHRSHEAMYVDRILGTGDLEWGICGVGVMPFDLAMRDALAAQDNLYTLVTVAPDKTTDARIIGSISEYLYAPDDPAAVLAKLVDPSTRIVSLTITEGGYSVNDATGEFDPKDPATLADLADQDGIPRSVLGFIVAALRLRRANGTAPFTVMSCDNIQGNGTIARIAVTGFARKSDVDFADWIDENVVFPNSMVDRITPATTDETRSAIAQYFDVEDLWPVRSEAFEQWVLEDRFTLGRPRFESVGVQLVADVEPYELMKLRLLNASHQAMSYLGILAGGTYVHEVCRDELFRSFLLTYMHEEAIPTLRPVPGIDLEQYCDQLIARFSSEAILDTLARQVVDGSDRIPKFLLPVIREQLTADGDFRRSALVLAAWSIFLEGTTEDGAPTPISDRRIGALEAAISEEHLVEGSFLDQSEIFGDLGADPRLRSAFIAARAQLKARGARATITDILAR